MNQIQQLINQMCPNGVEWKTLGEVCEIVRGASPRPIGAYLTTAADGIPWIKIGDVNPNSRFIESTVEKITAEGAAHSRFLHKGDFVLSNSMSFGRPYILKIDGCIHDGWVSISKFDKHLISEYLFYILKSDVVQYHWRQKAGKGSVANLNADIIKATPIPLPPLAIQTRIVEILDHFTNLTANLTAELNLRRKQFEHYREKLLSLDGVEGVEWKKLGEVVVSLKTGLNPRDNFVLNADGADCYYITGKEIRNNIIQVSDKTDLIFKDVVKLINKRAQLHSNVLLFASTGTGTVGRMAIVEEYNEEWNVSETLYIITPKECILLRFMMYVLYSNVAVNQFTPKISKGSVPHLKVVDLLNTKIPIPPLATQHSIVSILDKFTALIENIEKELALRQKQYEYYREELLRFGG